MSQNIESKGVTGKILIPWHLAAINRRVLSQLYILFRLVMLVMLSWYPPPPSVPQNIENKEQDKALPRKIFHPKGLWVKYSILRT